MKPSNFTSNPMGSVLRKSEFETVAQNIMLILKRTGDVFRELTWEEYKEERLKDRNFSEREKQYFDGVIGYCNSADKAVLFCNNWAKKQNKTSKTRRIFALSKK